MKFLFAILFNLVQSVSFTGYAVIYVHGGVQGLNANDSK